MSTPLPDPEPGGIAIASLPQAKKHKRRFDAVITLEDPLCRPASRLRFLKSPAPPHLVLGFEDFDDDTLGVRVATRDQIAEALAFARRHREGALLVHCFQGLGRSAAVALAAFADRLGSGREPEALDQVLAVRPQASPNRVVVKLADALLERGGALIAAVDAWEAVTPRVLERRAHKLKFLLANPQLYAWVRDDAS